MPTIIINRQPIPFEMVPPNDFPPAKAPNITMTTNNPIQNSIFLPANKHKYLLIWFIF